MLNNGVLDSLQKEVTTIQEDLISLNDLHKQLNEDHTSDYLSLSIVDSIGIPKSDYNLSRLLQDDNVRDALFELIDIQTDRLQLRLLELSNYKVLKMDKATYYLRRFGNILFFHYPIKTAFGVLIGIIFDGLYIALYPSLQ